MAAQQLMESTTQTLSNLVAVYGTLKRGLSNHELLQHASFVGEDCLTCITLYDLGPYPGARFEHSEGIDVEVYAVDELQLQQLDALEEYLATAPDQGMYDRRQVLTKFGRAWIYLYNREVDQKRALRSGAWQPNC